MTDTELYQMATDHAGDIADDVARMPFGLSRDATIGIIRRVLLDFAELVRKNEFVERWKPSTRS